MYLKTKTLTTAALLSFYLSASTVLAATVPITITADDSVAGIGTNLSIKGLYGEATVVVLPPYGSEILKAVQSENGELVELHIAGTDMQEAGLYEVSLEQDGQLLSETTKQFTVLADTVDLQNSTIQSDHNMVNIDANEEVEVSVILRDRYGNSISGRPVKLISSRSSDRIEMVNSQTDERGEQHFIVSAQDAGNIALRAVDLLSGNVLASDLQLLASTMQQGVGGYLPTAYTNMYAPQPSNNQGTPYNGGSNLIGSVSGRALYGQISSFDVVDKFVIEMPVDTKIGIALPAVIVTAIDINGQIVEDYTGTIELSSTDPNAILLSRGKTTFSESEQGVKRIPLGITFKTPGQQILHVQDSQDSSVMGESAINVIGNIVQEPKQTIVISSPKQNGVLNTTEIVVKGTAAPYANLIITGGKDDAYGETDAEGFFEIPVDLNEDQIDHTLRIRDESGQNDSGNLRLKLDVIAPEIDKLSFTPTAPHVEEDILVVAHISDDNDNPPSVMLFINETELTLSSTDDDANVYQVLFNIDTAGSYQPKLVVTDGAGNIKEMLSSLEVRSKELPRIQNVQVEPKPSSVMLQWDPAVLADDEDPISGYRIYVGDSPANFSHTLDTAADTLAANVAGLKPGSTYYFAVTALRADEESPHKSELISAVIPGLTLEVIPGNASLILNWADIAEEYSLSHFILSYGASQASMSEVRKLNSNLTTYAMRDLINGVTYYISLVPISTEGEALNDLAVDGNGTPVTTIAGFFPGPADPIPAGLGSGPGFTQPVDPTPPISLHGGAPAQPTTGIPFSKWWIVISGALCAGLFTLRRQKTLRTTNAFMHSMQQRYTEEHLS